MEELLGRYRDYLIGERGADGGHGARLRGLRAAVRRSPGCAATLLSLAGVTAADVTGFVLAACPGRAVGSAKLIVCALRSLLRWLHLTGRCRRRWRRRCRRWRAGGCRACRRAWNRASCAGCWPAVIGARRTGRRDYAIMLLLSRLGLRAGEVARLGLDDIDWRRGEIAVLRQGQPQPNGCRCRPTSGRRSRPTCAAAGRAPRRAAACSCGCTPRTGR